MSHGRFFGSRRVPRLPTVMRSTTKIPAMSAGYARYAPYATEPHSAWWSDWRSRWAGGATTQRRHHHYAGLFPTDLSDIASRLDAAARVTIASHGASSDAEPSPTIAPTRTSQHQSAGTRKPPLTCIN